LKFSLTLNCITGCQVVGVIMTSHVEQTTVQILLLVMGSQSEFRDKIKLLVTERVNVRGSPDIL